MTIKLKVSSSGVSSWKNVSQIKLKVNGVWRNVSQAKLKVAGAWRNIFSSSLTPSIQARVTISLSGGINASSNMMNDYDLVTITSTRFHWEDADGYTYAWQKSADSLIWEDIDPDESTTNPASGSSSSSLTLTLSPSYFTSGPDMYFRFSYRATNSTYSTSASSESLSKLVSYYGTPVPIGQSPSITGSTVVGNTASANIGTWTNSPTSYNYRVYYTSGLSSYPLTYAGVKSVSNKYLSGLSAVLITSSNHLYKANDTVVVSGMDALFNGSHVITAIASNEIYFDLPAPTAFSLTGSVASGQFVSFNGDAYQAASALSASSAWTNAGTAYSVGNNVYYNSNRYRANSSLSGISAYNGGTIYSSGAIVYSGSNRYQSTMNDNIGNSVTNYIYWTDLGSYAPGSNSMWTSVMPNNASFWVLQSFSGQLASGTTTAPNYYEGTVYSSTSIPVPITTFDYKQNIDLRGATSSGSGAVLNFSVKAYNTATLLPSEYLGSAFIYGIPILSIGSITRQYTTASIPFTSSYVRAYLLNLYTQPTITNIIGGATTVTYFAQNIFTTGQQVTITGVNPSSYNGIRTIQSANSTSFTVSANIIDSYISGGTAKVTVSGYPLTIVSNTSPRSLSGLSEGTTYYLEMTPSNNGMFGTIQTSSFTTLKQPTISGISVSNTTQFPGSASSISVSNTPPSNTGSVSWANGSNTSAAVLYSVTGAGSGGSFTDPSSLLTSGTFSVVSTGTANASIRAINTSKTVHATWTQTNTQSYRLLYTVSGVPGTQEITGNSSASNPSVLLGTSANTFTITNITVYPDINQGGTGVTLSSTASATGADRITDTAGSGSVTFTPLTWTITWSANGGTGGGTTTQNRGTSHTAPSPGTRSGFTFQFWRYPATGFDILNTVSDGGTFNPAQDMTFAAVWAVIQYTVTYDANGGTVSPTSATVNAGSSVTLPSPSRSGFTFNGWYTASSGGSFLGFGGTSYTPTSSITIYAQWTVVTYTVTWNANGGTVSPTSNTGASGTTVTTPTPTRSGFTFSGWASTASGDFTSGPTAGSSYTITETTSWFARWAVPLPVISSIVARNGGTGGAYKMQWTITSTNTASYSITIRYGSTTATANTSFNTVSSNPIQTNVGNTINDYYILSIRPWSGPGGTGSAGTERTTTIKRNTATPTNTTNNY
jgi:uncharacterized repeat protein (TIGR02543 family)